MNFESQKVEELIRTNSHHNQPLINYHKSIIKSRKTKGSLSRKAKWLFEINFLFTHNLFKSY
jgi:stalled ribosome alternative rescue factor ArfA